MKKLLKSKSGIMDQLPSIVTALVVIGITLVVGLLIMSEVADNSKVAADNNASVAVDEVQAAISDIPTWLSIVVIAIIGALLIGLVGLFRRR